MYWQFLARTPRRGQLAVVAVLMSILVFSYWQRQTQYSLRDGKVLLTEQHGSVTGFRGTSMYEDLPMSGYVNARIPDGPNCNDIRVENQQHISVTKSIYLEDDLLLMAENLNHPMIDYSGQPKGLGFKEQLRRTWGRMAGSSVWLEQYRIYFTVSRVFFYTQGVKHWPSISFIRAQVYDEDWNHLDGYQLEWKGQNFTYPQVLSIPSYFKVGDGFFGPEDPRITLEPDVQDAEPVIIFNMRDKNAVRSMNIYRPFSNFTTTLHIEEAEEKLAEKNWSPFFVPQAKEVGKGDQRYPSTYIHFVYDWHPLQVLRCHLMNGYCKWVYRQDQQELGWDAYNKDHKYGDTHGVMRGGTNFVPVPFEKRPGLTSFVGFPRTHTEAGCGKKDAIYRPVMMLLTTNGTHYWLDYASDFLNFGHSVMTEEQYEDPCDKGRILLGNGIARYEHEENRDLMTVLFTVADSTVQVANIHGIRKLIQSLPQMQAGHSMEELEQDIPWKLNVSHDVLICSMQTASDYALAHTHEVEEPPKEG